jgi:type II secretory pathway pseudopilin PulG
MLLHPGGHVKKHIPDYFRPGLSRGGFSLIEAMVATVVALIVFFSLARVYAGGQAQLAVEENHRKAVSVAQAHLDAFRRDNRFDQLGDNGGGGNDYPGGGDEDDDDDDDDDEGDGNWARDGGGGGGGNNPGSDTVYTVDGLDFTVFETVQVGVPETHAATVEITVSWSDTFKGQEIPRTLSCTTIVGRSVE